MSAARVPLFAMVWMLSILGLTPLRAGAQVTCGPASVFGPGASYASGSYPTNATIGDFYRDGAPDIAVSNYSGASIALFRNTGGGTSAAASIISAGEPSRAMRWS